MENRLERLAPRKLGKLQKFKETISLALQMCLKRDLLVFCGSTPNEFVKWLFPLRTGGGFCRRKSQNASPPRAQMNRARREGRADKNKVIYEHNDRGDILPIKALPARRRTLFWDKSYVYILYLLSFPYIVL